MNRLHFAYALPGEVNKNIHTYIHKQLQALNLVSYPVYRNGYINSVKWPSPINAPFSITYYLWKALQKEYKLQIYDLRETGKFSVSDKDKALCHFWPDTSDSNSTEWKTPDYKSVAYQLLKASGNREFYAIGPYNHDVKQVGWLTEVFASTQKIKFIAICGQYWIDTWYNSPFCQYLSKDKVLQVNMCIDSTQYPYIKRTFSPKTKRKFLYVGRTSYPKNTKALEDIAEKYPNFEGGYISDGQIKNWKKIADYSHLTPAFVSELAKEYDFFLSTSSADAQATTVLEHMSLGFGVACTPESGYTYDSIIPLSCSDSEYNCSQIEKMQSFEEEELLFKAQSNRKIVEDFHNWSYFTKQVLNFIK